MISILTTIYNGSEFLKEAVDSVLLQKDHYDTIHIQWEWLIGINGHGEGGAPLALANSLATDPRIRVINLPEARGRTQALNTLRLQSTGDWIAILDCDDIWEPEKLITQMIAIHMSPTIDIIGTFCTYFGEHAGSPRLPSGWIRPEQVFLENPIINSSVLMRADVAVWEERFGLEDYDLWIRSAKNGKKMFIIPHPLVRHRIHSASAFNGKGGQRLDELRAYHAVSKPLRSMPLRSMPLRSKPTVVTAYYPVPSKYPVTEYIKWITHFWPHMQCNLVFYTEPSLVGVFEAAFAKRGNTKIIGLPFLSLAAFHKLSPRIWIDTRALDSEKSHTPELYALWYEKKEFVLRTIQNNPFQSTEFVWCDAGIGRYPEWISILQGFPATECIPKGRMLVLQIDPFHQEDTIADTYGIPGRFDQRSSIGAGILASDSDGWYQWSKEYDAMLLRYHLAGRFIGKDQNIIASMILNKPSLAAIVMRPASLGPVRGWFYLLFVLSGLLLQ